ncbi:MAG: primary-amine oxidase [Acidobacteriota bacterium]|nr:primary-amine oxidase [Acidobacteriota bacterium]
MKKSLLALALVSSIANIAAAAQDHPMDSLSGGEIHRAVSILQNQHLVDPASRFPLITLKEPPKAFVLAWQPGQPVPRSAFAIIKQGPRTFEAVIDLTLGVVVSWNEAHDVQPSILLEEFFGAIGLVAENPEFLAGLAARGLTPDQVFCAPLSAGYFAIPEHEGRRLLRLSCFQFGESSNFLAQPIGGLHAVVDTNTGEVLEVTDEGARPMPQELSEYRQSLVEPLRPPLKPVVLAQRLGSNVEIAAVEGGVIKWQKWSFHQRLDRRLGLILSLVSFKDGGQERPVLYQGSLSELFVPYQTDDPNWFYRTFMDVGEYGFGANGSPLVPGADCPETALMLDAVLPDDTGGFYRLPNAVAVFERNTGDPAWRHFDAITGALESRPAVELVVRSIAAVGNYDYLTDWIFTQDGRIRVSVSATGIDLPDAVQSAHLSDPTAAADTRYGTLVAPHVLANNHDHWFSFRLDLDVDGAANTFVRNDLEPVTFDTGPRRSAWKVVPHVARTESDAQLDHGDALWTVVNPSRQNRLGYPVGYELDPLNSAHEYLMSGDDPPTRRALFATHNLWVTPYRPDEIYAAGVYVNQSKGGDGLPAWTAADRPIENTDIVLWYTLGFHHVPRAEDWPVMPLEQHSFELRPANFFDRSPVLDLRQGFRRKP